MRVVTRSFMPIMAVAASGLAGGCMNPEVEAKQWDEIQAVAATVTELKTYNSDLETLVDSLHRVVAKQDSAIRVLIEFTGAQVPAYRQQ